MFFGPGPARAQMLVFSPTMEGDLRALDVSITFPGETSGLTTVTFPSEWGPESALGGLVSDIAITGGDPLPRPGGEDESGTFVIRHDASATLNLRYTVRQDYEGEPRWGVQRVPGMRPVLQAGRATLIGHTFLPEISGEDRQMTVAFEGFPSTGAVAFNRPLSTDRTFGLIPWSDAKNSIYVFGDFRVSEVADADLSVRTAIRGRFATSDEALAEAARSVLTSASTVFHDAPFEQYFIAIDALPPLPEGSAVIGAGLSEGFFLIATENADAENLIHTLTHEILHEWITRRMGETDEATDPRRMWFTEGFTEYFTHLFLLRSGQTGLEQFVDGLNNLWLEYQRSPVNTLPVDALAERLWESRETERLPYQRGALLALHWDSALEATTDQRLADVVGDLLNRAENERRNGSAARLDDREIRDALVRAPGIRFDEDYATYLGDGTVLAPGDLRPHRCLRVLQREDGLHQLAVDPRFAPEDCVRLIVDATGA